MDIPFTMSNRQQELASPKKTAIGKDFSNPLIVDSLLKTIWSSIHHVFTMKHWLVQSKRLLHNMVAFLEKSTGSVGFHQVIDFLNRSHICYALTKKPDVYISFIKQFWRSAEASTDDNGEVQITATIDGHSMSITEASLRRHLKLDDQDGITSIPNSEIFEQLALMGYHTDSDKLTFQKGAFSPQWRFLIHNILHCLSPKKTAWEQFSSNIATAVICLATNRKYNFSRMIFEHMVSNISSPHKFLMYPRFIQICLDMQRNQLQQHSRTYLVPSLSVKVFNNMKRPTKGYSGQEVALFPTMLDVTEPSTSPSRITSSPSPSPEPSTQHSPDHTTAAPTQPSPTQPSLTQPTQPSPGAEHNFPTPHDLPLHAVYSHRSDEGSLKLNELTTLVTKLSDRIRVLEDDLRKTKKIYSSAFTKLILRVKKLESQIKTGKTRRKLGLFIQMMKMFKMILPNRGGNYLMQNSEKGSTEVSTAGATKEGVKSKGRKEKGKAIMTESEPNKKSKKELEQERLSFAEAIRLEEQMNKEQRAQIARDEEIAKQWDKEERQRAMSEAKSTKKIDWNDPSVIRYHALKMKPKTIAQARRNMIKYLKNQGNYKIRDFKGMSYNEIRPIFEKVWDFNQHIEPMEHGSEKMKSTKKIEEKDADTQKEVKEVAKESGAKRKKSLPRKRRIVKRLKLEEDAEKEELKWFLDIIPREEFAEDVESLSTKYPIVDWKTYTLTKNFMYYQIFRGDGSSKNYKVLSEMLEDFDRQDVEELYRLVKERYSASRPEGYDLMLWGDLHTLFEPDEEDEIWKNQHEYNVISWSLYDFCGIHILLMQNGIAIHMLTEKKYPLSQEMISKMLKKKLEVDHESSQAFELLSVNDTLTAKLERYKEQVKVLKERQNVDLRSNDNISDSSAQSVEIDRLKQTLSEYLKEKESLIQTVTLLKNDFKKEESRNIDREIALEKRIKQLDNLKAQQLEPKLYDGNVIKKTSAIVIPDFEETLMLAEESRSKMLFKTKRSYDNFVNSPEPTLSSRPTKVKVPKELSKFSMVNTSLKKLKYHLAGFDVVVKERTTPTAITEGSWEFEHTKACFRDEIIPFVIALKDLFNTFNQYLIDELFEVQNVFHQMEQAVEQHCVESKTFEEKMNQVLNENERLLEQVINKDIVNIIMNYSMDNVSVNMHECEKCLKLKIELLNKKDFIEKEIYDKLFKSFTTLEKHCISLEVDTQLNQEIFQRDNSISNQTLKDDLRKLKGKALVDNVVTKHTIDPEMLKIDVEPIPPKLLNKKTAHSAYIKHTQEEAIVLRDLVEHVKSKYPLDHSLESACRQGLSIEFSPSLIIRKDLGMMSFVQLLYKLVTVLLGCAIDNGTEFVNQTLREYYKKVGISHETSVARSSQQNGVVERRNCTLIEVARTMLIYAKAPLFLWAEAVATAYFDEIPAMDFKHSSLGPALYEMTPATINSGLVPNPPPSTPFIPPSRTDWDILFPLMFDELLTPPPSVDYPTSEVVAPIHVVVALVPAVSTSSPSSTNVDQDAPSLSHS
ncbi:retrovirus-related pol polyprotein from transposon TNT 1-94 [Tanacetum coccineum]